MDDKKKKARKRYKLHRKIRDEGYNLKTWERTIYIPYTQTFLSNNVLLLRDVYGYGIQIEIV